MVKITKKWANIVYFLFFFKGLQNLGIFQSQFSLINLLYSCFFPDLTSSQLQKIQMLLFFLVGGSIIFKIPYILAYKPRFLDNFLIKNTEGPGVELRSKNKGAKIILEEKGLFCWSIVRKNWFDLLEMIW